ncbi:hypothetical protein PLICRDRAFT_543309 [Plicaturopsis crispa FD-325 SS-3]|nr:hypothetical protein PLICRDRAFT_543309 [Plicaturopsis crispa FD-325 SS-3]
MHLLNMARTETSRRSGPSVQTQKLKMDRRSTKNVRWHSTLFVFTSALASQCSRRTSCPQVEYSCIPHWQLHWRRHIIVCIHSTVLGSRSLILSFSECPVP